jgi:hypothetical protein
MQVIGIKDIVRKDVPIYYRLLYTGVAVLELTKKQAEYRIDFSIEIKPTGQKEIIVTFLDDLEFPLIPISKELKNQINTLHTNGLLPD